MKQKELERLKRWTEQVTKGQRDSAVFMSLWSDTMREKPWDDPVPVMQLGYAMLLDKPIVIVAPLGSRIPENVQRAARAVEFYHRDDMDSMHAATLRALAAAGLPVPH
jgi:hypothetical protein